MANKKQAIVKFVRQVDAIKQQVKEDALKMVSACPLEVLADPVKLEDYLHEMLDVITKKYLLKDNHKMQKGTAVIISDYVNILRRKK